jgi:hypothetical protein
MEPSDPERKRLKQLLNEVTVGAAEATTEVSLCEGGDITHSVDEKLRVRGTVFLL